ncbi:MAG TPA: biopolymer transporter ExbD [Polyangiaceae bacterium LLY-WYZ-14_1]|nr:biopolymer transporter ExbD [Polyangiaceae bacterium LLY-WYZ-14_1]
MGGGTFGGDDGDDMITGINVTPLVDVVLVLLIILMVTATAIVSKSIQVELPKAETGENTPRAEQISISIDEEGSLFLDAEPVTMQSMRARVRSLREDNPELRAIIAADGRIAHRQVIQVIDLLRQERVNKFAFNVRPEDVDR